MSLVILMVNFINSENEPCTEHSRERVEKILQRLEALPTLNPADADEILGYDENGLPA